MASILKIAARGNVILHKDVSEKIVLEHVDSVLLSPPLSLEITLGIIEF